METGEIQIHTENIFPIIKKAVYSDHEIFLRELISNSVDAINKRKMASMAGDCVNSEEDGIVNIKIDREKKTLIISDNGIGMTIDEVKKYINQVAFSSAEDFLAKYKKDNTEFIGHFGLGFYSSFMVSSNVEIITKSARENSIPCIWKCDGSPKFTIQETEKDSIGTDIVLHLLEEEKEFIEPTRIKNLIKKYCDFMPIDVKFEDETINKKNPPWRKSQNELLDKDYIELYNYLYPFQGDPLLWIHLSTDYPYDLQGILYFPKITGRADWENGEIKLYCNQVFVSDSIKEVVPRYLLPLRGVLDSSDIPLNVSRSALQTDRRVRSISSFISKKIASKLTELYKEQPEFYANIWGSLSSFIKIGSIEDDKFADKVKGNILFETLLPSEKLKDLSKINVIESEKKYYTSLDSYIERNKDGEKTIAMYCTNEVSQSNILKLWLDQNKEVLIADPVIDTQFLPWLESKFENVQFQRVDAEIGNQLKDNSPDLADEVGETDTEKLSEIIKKAINNDKVTIQIQSLKNTDAPPSIILLPEQMRRINDMGALMEQRLPGIPEHHVLLVNKKHPLVKGLLSISTNNILDSKGNTMGDDLSAEIAGHIYDIAKLSIGGLNQDEVNKYQNRNSMLLSKLINKVL